MCQLDIEGYEGLNCYSCTVNGPGKCDPDGCPTPQVLYYNQTLQMCLEIEPKTCKHRDRLLTLHKLTVI